MSAHEELHNELAMILEARPAAEGVLPAAAETVLPVRSDGGAAGCRVLHVEAFEPSCALAPDEADAYERRFVTLFEEPGAPRAGGRGAVMRVSNLWGEVFALKVLAGPGEGERAGDGAAQTRLRMREEAFRGEYRIQCALSGLAGFPRVYGCGRVGGAPALVMEWVEGVTLAKAARLLAVDDEGRVSPLVAARIGRDLFELVARMGFVEGGIAHRDISSGNVMVRTDRLSLDEQVDEGAYDLCLVDFGSAAAATATPGGALAAGCGATADFAAPELLAGGAGTHAGARAADVYAAASVVWALAAGAPPFGAAGDLGVDALREAKEHGVARAWESAHASSDVAAVLMREPEVSVAVRRASADMTPPPAPDEVAEALCAADEALGSILGACLASDPALRPDADQVRDALGSFSFHYADNIGRMLRGEPAIPLAPGGLVDGYGGAAQRRRPVVRVAGKAVSAVVGLSAFATAAVLAGSGAGFPGLGIPAGVLSGAAAVIATALPPLAGSLARWRSRGARGLARAAVGTAAGAALSFAIGAAAQLDDGLVGGFAAALLASTAAAWCFFAADFVAPAFDARRARKTRVRGALSAASSSPSAAGMLDERSEEGRGGDFQGGSV